MMSVGDHRDSQVQNWHECSQVALIREAPAIYQLKKVYVI